jgi:ribosome assembly protein YihI (activator of Der GTPase)
MAEPSPTEKQKCTAAAAAEYMEYLGVVPVAMTLAEPVGVRDQAQADEHLARMRALLEQNGVGEDEDET